MRRISEAIEEIVSAHQGLRFGFHNGLLNLSQVARFLKPSIEAQTHKEVTTSAVLMNLSRLQRKLGGRSIQEPSSDELLVLDKVNVQSGLCSATLIKTPTSHNELNRVFNRVYARNGFITITEGIRQTTVILEAENLNVLLSAASSPPIIVHRDLASVSMTFNERYLNVKGILSQLLAEVALHNINVIELTSTATEFSVFLKEDDVQLAFDALYNRYGRRGPPTGAPASTAAIPKRAPEMPGGD